MKKTALIAMSGGVDSTAAAYLLQQEGFDCQGAIMRLAPGSDVCGSSRDAEDAAAAAAHLGIPFSVLDASAEFDRRVIVPFVAAYEAACTPNPCILCNQAMKFGRFFDAAMAMGLDYMATGHYVRLRQSPEGRWQLLRGLHAEKDQSYVLYQLTQEQLARCRFPLGELSKAEARSLLESQGFANARRKDSQDICFIPDGDYAAFIRRRTGRAYPEGDFVDTSGHVLGRHRGLICYTVGQRRGLGISGGRPLYVKELRPEDNTVVLAEDAELYERTLWASDFNWVSIPAPREPIRVKARARYHMPEQWATARILGDRVQVTFDAPQRALTRGQAVVLYADELVLGGGTIVSTAP